jgi:hypothetical protein
LHEVQRNNVRITIDKIADYVDPPRFIPLIGPAQLHHAHYKCTIYYTEVTRVGWPIPYTTRNEDAREVIYIDHNHFHMVGNVDTGAFQPLLIVLDGFVQLTLSHDRISAGTDRRPIFLRPTACSATRNEIRSKASRASRASRGSPCEAASLRGSSAPAAADPILPQCPRSSLPDVHQLSFPQTGDQFGQGRATTRRVAR